jgi:hypothetical protein
MKLQLALAALLTMLRLTALAADGDASGAAPLPALPGDSAALFEPTKVWSVHLSVTAENWNKMEPKGGGLFAPPPPPPPRADGKDVELQFGPAVFMAPAFMTQADRDKDEQISADEFRSVGEQWMNEWDKERSGKISLEQLRDGLNAAFALPGFGPSRPDAPRQRVQGFNLQGAPGKRNGVASVFGIEFVQVKADLEFEGQPFKDVGLRYKGNGTFLESRGTNKRSFKIDLNEVVKGQKLAGVSRINLHNNHTDASWMNEVLSHRLFRDAGVPAPRTSYARVYVTVPGTYDRQYLGLYSIVENVDGNFAEHNFKTTKGALFKPVTPDPFYDLGDDFEKYVQTYDPKTELSDEQKQRLIDLCKLNTHADDETFAREIGNFIELDNFARFLAVSVFLSDLDGLLGPGQNYYIHLHPDTNKFTFIAWDQDHSFGQFPLAGSPQQRETLSIHKPWRGQNPFLERCFKIESFKKLYLSKIEEFSSTLFKPERFHDQVDELAGAIRPAVAEESAGKLKRFSRVVNGQYPDTFTFFGQPMKPIKPFVKIRLQSIQDQLEGKAEGATLGQFTFGPPPDQKQQNRRNTFGPGFMLAPHFMRDFDADKDNELTRDELTAGLAKWFEGWNTNASDPLTDEELRAGIGTTFAPRGAVPQRR